MERESRTKQIAFTYFFVEKFFKISDDAGKSCSIEAGKATVTCSSTGVSISIDKCVVPEVPATALHLNDASCMGVEQSESQWKIESNSVHGCGSSATFDQGVLRFGNALHIGKPVANGIVFGRSAEVGFSCNYKSQASAVSSFTSRTGFKLMQVRIHFSFLTWQFKTKKNSFKAMLFHQFLSMPEISTTM